MKALTRASLSGALVPLKVPLVPVTALGSSGMTTGPGTPASPWCTCAARGGPLRSCTRTVYVSVLSAFTRNCALPVAGVSAAICPRISPALLAVVWTFT